jgi:RimJ/RimL family protein N-acetyltransferase
MNICLVAMTRELCHTYMRNFVPDPALFAPGQPYKPYCYEITACDAYFDRHKSLGRIHLAILLNEEPIGEVILKKIDWSAMCCTIGISLQCDHWKNKGYGTRAEILALEFAFEQMKLDTVYADAIHKNKRSQHVLVKVGFRETHWDDTFIYYRCDRATWRVQDWLSSEKPS